MAKQDTGCISYIGMTSIAIMSIYVLFTNPGQFFESAFNILSFLAIIVLIVYLAIFFPNYFSEKKKEIPNIKPEIKSKENVIDTPKILKKEKVIITEKDDIDFLEKLVSNLENYSTFEIKIDGKIELNGWLIYKSKIKTYKFKETFDNYEEAILYLKNLK